MIDHVSIAVRDLGKAEPFYAALLAPLGMRKLREWPDAAIGFGKTYPEFWINRRAALARVEGIAACTSACALLIRGRSKTFIPRRLRPAARPMARPACVRNITAAITRPSFATSTVTVSKL
jgi:catechol 2,3-dioxygenase-like lactoylglutathione lyase family enzyme